MPNTCIKHIALIVYQVKCQEKFFTTFQQLSWETPLFRWGQDQFSLAHLILTFAHKSQGGGGQEDYCPPPVYAPVYIYSRKHLIRLYIIYIYMYQWQRFSTSVCRRLNVCRDTLIPDSLVKSIPAILCAVWDRLSSITIRKDFPCTFIFNRSTQ